MPSVAVKLYSIFFKLLKHRLQTRIQTNFDTANPFGVTSRPKEESVAPANPSFYDGVTTKDIHIAPSPPSPSRSSYPTPLSSPTTRNPPPAPTPMTPRLPPATTGTAVPPPKPYQTPPTTAIATAAA
ncbi:hypothetical protein AAC387_Pa07g1938 [Persea americana]